MCGITEESSSLTAKSQQAHTFSGMQQGADNPNCALRPNRSRFARVMNCDRGNTLLSARIDSDKKAVSNIDEPLTIVETRSNCSEDDDAEKIYGFDIEKLLRNNNNSDRRRRAHKTCSTGMSDTNIQNERNQKVQRRVSFADSVGLNLASIRIVTDGRDTPPYLERHYQEFSQAKEIKPQLVAQFPQPIANFSDFLKQLTDKNVSLESIEVKDKAITGMIKVRNLAYEKTVVIRHSVDNWRSHNETTCLYVSPVYKHSKSSVHDNFSFHIDVDERWNSFEFCIRYSCDSQEFWDNNNGRNYRLLKQ